MSSAKATCKLIASAVFLLLLNRGEWKADGWDFSSDTFGPALDGDQPTGIANLPRFYFMSSDGLTTVSGSGRSGAMDWLSGLNSAGWSDWAGMVASIGCAIHCAAMPFVIAYLPALGLNFLADEAFHRWMAVGCFFVALAAFVPGFRTHGRFAPAMVGSVGLVLISVAAFGLAGDCCAGCSEKTAAVSPRLVADQTEQPLVATPEPIKCTDACCQLCAKSDSASSKELVAGDSLAIDLAGVSPCKPALASFSLLGLSSSRIAPWLTPVGGILLVLAHLLNRRCGNVCGCCQNEPVAKAA